jgi:uncharacterized membrane protein
MSLQKIESGRSAKHARASGLRTHRKESAGSKEASGTDKALTYVLFGLLLLCILAVIYIVLNPPMGEKYTEFYILGPEEKAYNYPISLKTGQNGTVVIGVVNKEQEPMEYVLRVRLDNETMQEKDLLLANGQSYKARFTFTPHTAGDQRKMEFLLYKKGYSTPYRNLHLWLDVKAAE